MNNKRYSLRFLFEMAVGLLVLVMLNLIGSKAAAFFALIAFRPLIFRTASGYDAELSRVYILLLKQTAVIISALIIFTFLFLLLFDGLTPVLENKYLVLYIFISSFLIVHGAAGFIYFRKKRIDT